MRLKLFIALATTAFASSVAAQQFEIFLGEPSGPPPGDQKPINYLARCLANPDDRISCAIAQSATVDGGLESAVSGQLGTSAYTTCNRDKGVCLELATLDLDDRPGRPPSQRLPAVDITITFDFDSSDLRPDQAGKVRQIAGALLDEANAAQRFLVIGHTDSKGTEAYNCELSTARAQTVAAKLASLGIGFQRLNVMGAGEHLLLNAANGEAEVNRRVGFARIGAGTEGIVAKLSALCRS